MRVICKRRHRLNCLIKTYITWPQNFAMEFLAWSITVHGTSIIAFLFGAWHGLQPRGMLGIMSLKARPRATRVHVFPSVITSPL